MQVGSDKQKSLVQKILIPAATLFVIWLLLSGHFEVWLLALGVLTCILIAMLGARLGVLDPDEHSIRFFFRSFTYFPWLVREIVKSNIDVTRIIWRFGKPLRPKVFWTTASQKTDKGLVLYANSITLTPGTISINSEPGQIEVHAIGYQGEDGLKEGEMNLRIAKLEEDH